MWLVKNPINTRVVPNFFLMTYDLAQMIIFPENTTEKCGDLNMWLVKKSLKYTAGAGGYAQIFYNDLWSCPDNYFSWGYFRKMWWFKYVTCKQIP